MGPPDPLNNIDSLMSQTEIMIINPHEKRKEGRPGTGSAVGNEDSKLLISCGGEYTTQVNNHINMADKSHIFLISD